MSTGQVPYAQAVGQQAPGGYPAQVAVPVGTAQPTVVAMPIQQQQMGGQPMPMMMPPPQQQQQMGGQPVMMQGGMGMQPTIGQCRSCGQPFQRRPGLQPTSDEYFRCPNCHGLNGADFGGCCSVQ